MWLLSLAIDLGDRLYVRLSISPLVHPFIHIFAWISIWSCVLYIATVLVNQSVSVCVFILPSVCVSYSLCLTRASLLWLFVYLLFGPFVYRSRCSHAPSICPSAHMAWNEYFLLSAFPSLSVLFYRYALLSISLPLRMSCV